MPIIDVQLGNYQDPKNHITPVRGADFAIVYDNDLHKKYQRDIKRRGSKFYACEFEIGQRLTTLDPENTPGVDVEVIDPNSRRPLWVHISNNPACRVTLDFEQHNWFARKFQHRPEETTFMELTSVKAADIGNNTMAVQNYSTFLCLWRPDGGTFLMSKRAFGLLYAPK